MAVRRKRRGLIAAIILSLFLVLSAAGSFFGLGFWLSPQSDLSKSDAIVAISGGETDLRTTEAVKLYREGWAPTLIFAGAAQDPNSPSNASAMQRQAIALGVPPRAILLDEVSSNTEQNAVGVAKIVRDRQMSRIILVTSPYHQRRASIAFRRALPPETHILNHSTTDHAWRRTKWWANSYSYNLTISELQKTLYLLFISRS